MTSDLALGYRTSFCDLFNEDDQRPRVSSIRIPLVQRDYAQGRSGPQVEDIRTSFLDSLHTAVTTDEPLGLDFVYGDVTDGTLLPLDGQQRLTTLFLLHWYLCIRNGDAPENQPWSRFSYDTRPSARRFCERLVANPPPPDRTGLRNWIEDQPWFLHGWQHDPTITSMLTMIDAIEERFHETDTAAAWQRLTNVSQPAVFFLLLPIREVGAGDELYIKMNSRGKALTPFENFKARLERLLDWTPDDAHALAHKIDGTWSNLLWPLRGDDDIVDDEFLRYFEFIIEICEWRQGRLTNSHRIHDRAAAVFAKDAAQAADNIAFLFNAFDVWVNYADIEATFDRHFATAHRPATEDEPQSVVLFGSDARPNLLAECCRSYGELRGKSRVYSLSQTLLLYAVLLHRTLHTEDFPARLRILRNLLAESEDEVRRENMPNLVSDVDSLVAAQSRAEALARLKTFTKALTGAEAEKQRFLDAHPAAAPAVWRLEDHNLLRGSLGAFELDAQVLESRSAAFHSLFDDPANWKPLTGALLACGEYQRRRPNSEAWQFGTGSPSNDGVWRTLFTGSRTDLAGTRSALTELLHRFADTNLPPKVFLDGVIHDFVQERHQDAHLDWRYYLTKYDCMRDGATGIYYGDEGVLGYSLCMLRRTQLNSLYRDPFLLAIWEVSGVGDAVIDPWFTGYPSNPRRLQLRRSGVTLRCVDSGFELTAPEAPEDRQSWLEVIGRHGGRKASASDVHLVRVLRSDSSNDAWIDQEDRVVLAAKLVREMVEFRL